jgi:hypothetical protein
MAQGANGNATGDRRSVMVEDAAQGYCAQTTLVISLG